MPHPRWMLRWGEFAAERPDLAAKGRIMFYEAGAIGLGFLATVRKDGGPRVHPICPLLTEEGLYAFIVSGPKLDDLHRDPRYALHSETFPPPHHDDAFYLTGTAALIPDAVLREALAQQFMAERDFAFTRESIEPWELFEFRLDRCLLTLTEPEGAFPAGHTTWRAQGILELPPSLTLADLDDMRRHRFEEAPSDKAEEANG